MIFVIMRDNFFSGWGLAEGKIALYAIACENEEEAQQAEAAAKRRPDMSNIHTRKSLPQASDRVVLSVTPFKSLTGSWLTP